jgi:CBS domain-containing protein
MRAIEAGRQPPPTVPAGTPLHEVARLLASEGLRAVVITDPEGGPVGIVTERDLVVRGLAWSLPCDTPVEAVMTCELVTASPADPARFVYRLLGAHGIRQVPLVEGGRVVGIVDRDDLGDEAEAEVLAELRRCPGCGSEWLRPVSTAEATNFLCVFCRRCWHISGGAFSQVEPRSCRGCTEHNFCRFPLIDYGVDTARLPSPQSAAADPC